MPHVLRAAALANLGREEGAQAEVERLLVLDQGLTVTTAIRSARYVDRGTMEALADAVRRAGVPA